MKMPKPTDLRRELRARAKAEDQTDLVLVCGKDGTRFPCYRLVVETRSSVFRDMLETAGDFDHEVVIVEMDRATLEKFLEFLFTDSVDLTGAERDLLEAGFKYNIPGLVEAAGHALVSQLTAENVVEAIGIFERHNSGKNKYAKAAMKYATAHLKQGYNGRLAKWTSAEPS